MVSSASAMHDFNYSNPNAVFLNATSSRANQHIFLNPAAALPLTLYIGEIAVAAVLSFNGLSLPYLVNHGAEFTCA
jgi:hypothetical protein